MKNLLLGLTLLSSIIMSAEASMMYIQVDKKLESGNGITTFINPKIVIEDKAYFLGTQSLGGEQLVYRVADEICAALGYKTLVSYRAYMLGEEHEFYAHMKNTIFDTQVNSGPYNYQKYIGKVSCVNRPALEVEINN
ncbi:hypothetical protein M899_0672 [Bacteriovorax sp. BSW11_IV]|uniref:hypothetical protein n=1 Tax=Bacteriovorax sp. BSW11_IV TaxID=1353529 RepID=UPI000389F5C2|nr:hypothetical protein [Bacteriovorax sp. BSW11_IV]EQC49124.1 hypothetical protein M899_0672 [Bacteriovorax sp. BSW11_IV]